MKKCGRCKQACMHNNHASVSCRGKVPRLKCTVADAKIRHRPPRSHTLGKSCILPAGAEEEEWPCVASIFQHPITFLANIDSQHQERYLWLLAKSKLNICRCDCCILLSIHVDLPRMKTPDRRTCHDAFGAQALPSPASWSYTSPYVVVLSDLPSL